MSDLKAEIAAALNDVFDERFSEARLVALIKETTAPIQGTVDELKHEVWGNGQPGLVKDVSEIKGTLGNVATMVASLVERSEVQVGDRLTSTGSSGNLSSGNSRQAQGIAPATKTLGHFAGVLATLGILFWAWSHGYVEFSLQPDRPAAVAPPSLVEPE